MARRSAGPSTVGSGLRLGVFAVITLMALVMLTDALGGVSMPGTRYTAMFTDATGLLPGDEVRIAGAEVGEVDSIDLKQGDTPLAAVTFSMDSERSIPSSAEATIRYRNMVGQRYVALTPAADGEQPSKESLNPGDVIGVRQTSPALDLTVLLNGFKPLFRALSPDEVNELSYEIVQTLQGEASTVEGLLRHTASLTSTLAERDELIGDVINNLNEVLGTVAERDEQLDTTIVRLQEFISGLSGDRKALGEAVSSIGTLNTQTSSLVAEARPALDADVEALEVLSTTLNNNADDIETTLEELPQNYEQLTSAGSYGSWFNFFLCDFDGQVGLTEDVSLNPVGIHSPQPRCDAEGGE